MRPGARIGLGGIAKGYIAEAAANFLVARGIHDVLVAASGDMTARGRNGDRPWTIAIRDPRDPSGARATVRLEDESISTSGDYERFFVVDGRRYHHIIDPSTGYPATGQAYPSGNYGAAPAAGSAAAESLGEDEERPEAVNRIILDWMNRRFPR